MFDFENEFVWSDRIYIEDDESAWFIGEQLNALFKMNIKTGIYSYIKNFPDYGLDYEDIQAVCMKCGASVFCFPDIGSNIWVLDLVTDKLKEIPINNPLRARIRIKNVFAMGDCLFAVSIGLNCVMEIDVRTCEIVQYIPLLNNNMAGRLGEESVRAGEFIYCIAQDMRMVWEFNMETKEVRNYEIPLETKGLCTICYDGEKFWLSGFKKEIYIWDKGDGSVQKVDISDYCAANHIEGEQGQVFCSSLGIKNKMWFFPVQSGEILSIDKENLSIETVKIDGQGEGIISNKQSMGSRCILEYVLNDKYIGVYSFENKCVYEIDATEMTIVRKNYCMDVESRKKIWNIWLSSKKPIIREFGSKCLYILTDLCKEYETESSLKQETIGKKIFEALISDN